MDEGKRGETELESSTYKSERQSQYLRREGMCGYFYFLLVLWQSFSPAEGKPLGMLDKIH